MGHHRVFGTRLGRSCVISESKDDYCERSEHTLSNARQGGGEVGQQTSTNCPHVNQKGRQNTNLLQSMQKIMKVFENWKDHRYISQL